MVAGQRGWWEFGGGGATNRETDTGVIAGGSGGGGDVRDLKTPLPIHGREPVWPSGKAVGW